MNRTRPVPQNIKPPKFLYKGTHTPWAFCFNTFYGKPVQVEKIWFNLFNISFGIATIIDEDNWINDEALDYISLYYTIEIAKFDDVGNLDPETYKTWTKGDYLEDYGYYDGMTYLSVVNQDRKYVGDLSWALKLIELGIYRPEPAKESGNNCSIGWSLTYNQFYGWSHRSINGYKIGDVLREGDLATSSPWIAEYLQERPDIDKSLPVGFEIKTRDDCRKAAIAFADAVS